jgi:hypothetical protein
MTAYHDFVKEQMAKRPSGTPAHEWMKEIGKRWRTKKGGKLPPIKPIPPHPIGASKDEDSSDEEGGRIRRRRRTFRLSRRDSKHRTPLVMLPPYQGEPYS